MSYECKPLFASIELAHQHMPISCGPRFALTLAHKLPDPQVPPMSGFFSPLLLGSISVNYIFQECRSSGGYWIIDTQAATEPISTAHSGDRNERRDCGLWHDREAGALPARGWDSTCNLFIWNRKSFGWCFGSPTWSMSSDKIRHKSCACIARIVSMRVGRQCHCSEQSKFKQCFLLHIIYFAYSIVLGVCVSVCSA